MKTKFSGLTALLLCTLVGIFLATASDVRASDFYEQFAAVGCHATGGASEVVVTTHGPAVQPSGSGLDDVVLYCPVHVDGSNFFNALQIVAEDNTPDAYAQATLWEAPVVSPFTPAHPLATIRTRNKPGLQVGVNTQALYDTLDESKFVYWIEVRIVRTNPAAVVSVYSMGLLDLF